MLRRSIKQVCIVVANSLEMNDQYSVVVMVMQLISLCVAVLHESRESKLINAKIEVKFVN